MKTDRNGPCPCGSGLKYKKCCLHREQASDRTVCDTDHPGVRHFARVEAKRKERARHYGNVREFISTEFHGHRFVAIGNEIHYHKAWRTFPDFLFDYIKHALGSGWGQAELDKPLEDRHEVMQWYAHLCDVQKKHETDSDEVYSMVPDGICSAYLLLAYDLYVLRHHGRLQREVVRRLRRSDHVRGARYELFVTATFIRAGFDINFEDESDSSRKHPEFIATHRESGFSLALEAKAKHRPTDSVGYTGKPPEAPRANVANLLMKASEKKGEDPFVACVELGLPPEDTTGTPSWVSQVHKDLCSVIAEHGGCNPFDLVIFTDVPHQYGERGEPDPSKHYYAVWPDYSRVPENLIDTLGGAFRQYGAAPSEFPGEDQQTAV